MYSSFETRSNLISSSRPNKNRMNEKIKKANASTPRLLCLPAFHWTARLLWSELRSKLEQEYKRPLTFAELGAVMGCAKTTAYRWYEELDHPPLARRRHPAVKDKSPSQAKGTMTGFGVASPARPVSPAPDLDPRLAAAMARGEFARQQLAAEEGGSISSAQAAHLLGIYKQAALRRWHAHRLIGWKQGRAVRFPVWQFAGGKMMEGIEAILQIFASDDQWRIMLYFLAKRPSLGRRRPLDLLRKGKTAKVIRHAHVYALDNTW